MATDPLLGTAAAALFARAHVGQGPGPRRETRSRLLSDGTWFFDNTDENDDGLVDSFADDCR
jgi:hypothetical protein